MAIPCVNQFSQLADGDDSVAGVPAENIWMLGKR